MLNEDGLALGSVDTEEQRSVLGPHEGCSVSQESYRVHERWLGRYTASVKLLFVASAVADCSRGCMASK